MVLHKKYLLNLSTFTTNIKKIFKNYLNLNF